MFFPVVWSARSSGSTFSKGCPLRNRSANNVSDIPQPFLCFLILIILLQLSTLFNNSDIVFPSVFSLIFIYNISVSTGSGIFRGKEKAVHLRTAMYALFIKFSYFHVPVIISDSPSRLPDILVRIIDVVCRDISSAIRSSVGSLSDFSSDTECVISVSFLIFNLYKIRILFLTNGL